MAAKRRCHHGPIPPYLDEALVAAVEQYISAESPKARFRFGAYDSMKRTKAAAGSDLVRMKTMLVPLLSHQPSGRLLDSQFRHCVFIVLRNNKDKQLNHTGHDDLMFARWVSAQVLCALAHLRRLRYQPKRLHECKQKMSVPEQEDLDGLLALLEPGTDSDADPPTDEATRKRLRTLAPQVSMGSDGYPALSCLKDLNEDEEDEEQEEGQEDEEYEDDTAQVEEQDEDAQLDVAALAKALLGDDSRKLLETDADPLLQSAAAAARDPVPAVRGALKRQAMLKRPAAAQAKERKAVSSPVLGRLKLTEAAQKAYIQHFDEATGKWLHTVSVYSTTPDYAEIANKLLRYAASHPVDKTGLNEKKAEWVQAVQEGLQDASTLDSDCEGSHSPGSQ